MKHAQFTFEEGPDIQSIEQFLLFFTLHSDPWTDMVKDAGRPYPATDLDVVKLIKWQVKSQHKTEIVLDLERLAINSRTLFPDLEGLARGLWQTEVIRKCFEPTN